MLVYLFQSYAPSMHKLVCAMMQHISKGEEYNGVLFFALRFFDSLFQVLIHIVVPKKIDILFAYTAPRVLSQ